MRGCNGHPDVSMATPVARTLISHPDIPRAFSGQCSCGRIFAQPGAFKNHQNACLSSKEELTDVLSRSKGVLTTRKASRVASLRAASASTKRLFADVCPPTGSEEHLRVPLPETDPTISSAPLATRALNLPSESERPTKRRRIRLPPRLADFEMHDDTLHDVLPQAPISALSLSTLGTSGGTVVPGVNECMQSPGGADVGSHTAVKVLDTPMNIFGVFRRFHSITFPSHDPDACVDLSMLSNIVASTELEGLCSRDSSTSTPTFHPYPNHSAFLLGEWYWAQGNQKSQKSFKALLDIVGSPTFTPADIKSTNWAQVNRKLALNDWDESESEWMDEDAGWRRSTVKIQVPFHRHLSKPGPREYLITNFYHRSLTSVIREKLSKELDTRYFHYEPHELFWSPPHMKESIRLHGELYASRAFNTAHQDLQTAQGEPGCSLPRVVVALMFWSDETVLSNFGDAKLWPLYLFFGNESKYRRCKPSNNLCEHIAYFEALPDAFEDFASEHYEKKRLTSDFMSHCHRELIHEQWKLLLDDEFLHSYEHGMVIECVDHTKRRFYPRIFTYSCDYKDKVVMVTIRHLGDCPCPRCKVPFENLHLTGTESDRKDRITLKRYDDQDFKKAVSSARRKIYQENHKVTSAWVERKLKGESLVPTSNAFSEKLSQHGLDVFALFPVDLLHEVELGVWKGLFVHLLRILQSYDANLIHDLNRRFRLVPSFGRDTIRRFSVNTSDLQNMAARNYEDFLQTVIPVFEGLLPEPHNEQILQLLFHLAHWHALAKLRMHHEKTLDILGTQTQTLGEQFRFFKENTCTAFDTRELPREADKRHRGEVKKGSTSGGSACKPKQFNMNTYKFHSLGDYVEHIQMFGTTDSYSTEPGELEHRNPKGSYRRTSKKNFKKQLAQIERRKARIRRIRQGISTISSAADDNLNPASNDPAQRYHIGISQSQPQDIGAFLRMYLDDPAIKNFLPKLKDHLWSRLAGTQIMPGSMPGSSGADASPAIDREMMFFQNNMMYQHGILRVNYTTYDVRRAQDTINPRTNHCDIMLLSTTGRNPTAHPYRYARVLGIYHVNLIYNEPTVQRYQVRRMEFLWVRYFELIHDVPVKRGWSIARLDELQFHPIDHSGAFGFVDPGQVLRGCHIIPRFFSGECSTGVISFVQKPPDWGRYYANRFVDRDMVMRYHWGLGVGHVYSHHSGSGSYGSATTNAEQGGLKDNRGSNSVQVSAAGSASTTEDQLLQVCNQQIVTDATNDGDANDMLEDAQQDEIEGQILSQYSRRTRNFFHTVASSDSEESSDGENGTCATAVTAAVPLTGEKDADSDSEEYEYDDMYGDARDREITSYD